MGLPYPYPGVVMAITPVQEPVPPHFLGFSALCRYSWFLNRGYPNLTVISDFAILLRHRPGDWRPSSVARYLLRGEEDGTAVLLSLEKDGSTNCYRERNGPVSLTAYP